MRVTQQNTYPTRVARTKIHRDNAGIIAAESTVFQPMLAVVDNDDNAIALVPVRKIVRESVSGGSGINSTKPLQYTLFRITTNNFAKRPIVKREMVARSDNQSSLRDMMIEPRSLPYGHTVEWEIV